MAQAKKRRNCCISGCVSSSDTRLHLFPRERSLRSSWIELIESRTKTSNLNIGNRFKRVCHLHFEDKYIQKDGSRMIYAVPTLFSEEEINSGVASHAVTLEGNYIVPPHLKPNESLLSNEDYEIKYRKHSIYLDHNYSEVKKVKLTVTNKTDSAGPTSEAEHRQRMSTEYTRYCHQKSHEIPNLVQQSSYEIPNLEQQSSDEDTDHGEQIFVEETEHSYEWDLQLTRNEQQTEFDLLRSDEEMMHGLPSILENTESSQPEMANASVDQASCCHCGDVIPVFSPLSRCVQCAGLALLCARCVSAAHAHHTHALMLLPNTRTYRILEGIFQQLRLDVNELLSKDEQQQLQFEESPSSPITEPIVYYTIENEDSFYTQSTTAAYEDEVSSHFSTEPIEYYTIIDEEECFSKQNKTRDYEMEVQQPTIDLPPTKRKLEPSSETLKKSKETNIMSRFLVEESPRQVVSSGVGEAYPRVENASPGETTVLRGVAEAGPGIETVSSGLTSVLPDVAVGSPRVPTVVLERMALGSNTVETSKSNVTVTSPPSPRVVLERMSFGSTSYLTDVPNIWPCVTNASGDERLSPSIAAPSVNANATPTGATVSQLVTISQGKEGFSVSDRHCVWVPS